MFETLLVVLIVAYAAIYSVWNLSPASVRQQAISAFARRCGNDRAQAMVPGLQRAAAKPTGACADCGARSQCPVGRKLGR